MELVEASYQAQLRALEMVWSSSGPGAPAAVPPPASSPQSPAPAAQPARGEGSRRCTMTSWVRSGSFPGV